MKKIIAHIIPFLMVMPFFSACEDEIIVTTGDIIGNVSDQTTGEPIPTANVKLEPSGRSVVTGRDGNYQFSEVEGGTGYTITIAKEGYNSASRNVTVVPGQKAEVNFTLERIPAVVTADRDVLDFGDGKDVTTLPFNIVNAGYEDLEWHIEYDCGWIKEVKDNEGVLKHGKTQTIVVFIDREQLAAGENKTILVVRSSNGSSEVTVTAVGQEKKGAVLNTLDVKDVTGRTAVFCGEIVEEGYPEYTKRGFVYSLENTPTKDTSIEILTAKISDEKVFSVDVKGLELNTKYYVRAYAESALGTFYASNTVSFVTSGKEPVLSVQEVTDIDLNRNTAVLNGTVEFQGEPPYTEKGFVYATKNNPTIYNEVVISKGDGEGVFSEKVEGLKMGEKYHVRAYAKWNDKVYYSPEEVVFVTETAKAEVSVQEVTNMDVKNLSVTLNGSVDNPGNPSYSERGFVYGTYHNPTVKDDVKVVVEGNGTGAYSANIYNLVLGQTYYVRAYAVNESGTSYSPTEVSFTIEGSKPSVTVSDVSDIDLVNLKATFHGSIENSGVPVYTEKGFVYGTSHNPTISDNKLSVKGSEAGAFSAEASGLVLDQTYYVRAYATNNSGTSYSPTEVSFSMIGNATLELSSALLDFGTDKSEISVDIENTGNLGDIDWEVTSISESWLQVLPASGTLSMGKTATLKVLVDRNAITQSKQTAFTIKAADKEYVVTVKVSYQSTGGGNEGGGNDGGDGSVPEGTITSEDSRIIGELTSVKRNGTTVTVEYTLRNDGIGDMEDFHIYTCVGDDYKYTKIYDEEFNNYETTEFIFHDTKPQDSYKRYVRTRFPEKVKIAGKIVIRDFAETSEWMNIEMRIGSGYSDPELEGSYIYFKNLKIEGASASVVDETDGKDYSSAKISTGDTRIEPKILSCKRNGTTVTLEYRLRNNGIGDMEDFHIYTCVGEDYKYTKIFDEEFNDLETAEFTFHDTKPQDSYKRYVRTRFSDKVKTKGKIVIQNYPETSEKLNIEMRIGKGYSDPELEGVYINFKDVPVEGATAGEVDETDGKDYSSAKISTGDTRIEPKILSCKRNGTTVTLEYRLKNNGIGDMEDFHIYTCVGEDYKYTKIYDEEFNDLETAEFTFHDTKPQDSYKRYVRTRFSDKVKTKGKIVIQNYPETSEKLNIEMRIGRGYSDPELEGAYINFKDVPVEGATAGEVDETDGKDYSSAKISTGDTRIEPKILSCRRNGTTVTLEYRLKNNGIGDLEDFHIYTCVGDDDKYTKIYDEEFNDLKTAEFTFHDTKPQDSYKRYVRTRFSDKVKTKGKITIQNVPETSDQLNIEMTIGRGYSDPELNGNFINMKNIPIY